MSRYYSGMTGALIILLASAVMWPHPLHAKTDAQDTGASDDAKKTSIPATHIDLLYEADSYVPPFYRGRVLPLTPAHVHVQAITYFNATAVPDQNMRYTWRLNGAIQEGLSGVGKSAAVFPGPPLFGSDTISVDAVSTDGSFESSAAVTDVSTRPLVVLYEDHPLFGVLYHASLPSQFSIADSEGEFVAVPYFAAVKRPDDTTLRYTWEVNGKPAAPDPSDPTRIDAGNDAYGPLADITLDVTNTSDPFYNASGEWAVTFMRSMEGSGAGAVNPFLGR